MKDYKNSIALHINKGALVFAVLYVLAFLFFFDKKPDDVLIFACSLVFFSILVILDAFTNRALSFRESFAFKKKILWANWATIGFLCIACAFLLLFRWRMAPGIIVFLALFMIYAWKDVRALRAAIAFQSSDYANVVLNAVANSSGELRTADDIAKELKLNIDLVTCALEIFAGEGLIKKSKGEKGIQWSMPYEEGLQLRGVEEAPGHNVDAEDDSMPDIQNEEALYRDDLNPDKAPASNEKYEMIELFFQHPGEYMRFFLKLKTLSKATPGGDCIATLKKENGRYVYTLEWKNGQWISEDIKPFRANEENVRIFNAGCAELARRLRIYIETGDINQVPSKPLAFGRISFDSPEEEPTQPSNDRAIGNEKYFPHIENARAVRRYDAGTHEVVLLTDITSIGVVRYTHLMVAFPKGGKEPDFIVSAEENNTGDFGDDSHYLGGFSGFVHKNYGRSNDWADLDKFERRACGIIEQELNIRIQGRTS